MFLETIVCGLVLAAVSALSIIAYKHPRGYRKIEPVIVFGISIIYLVYIIWVLGYVQGFYAGKSIEGEFASPDYPIDPFPWLLIIVLIIQAYLIFLKKLPDILEINKDEEKKEQND